MNNHIKDLRAWAELTQAQLVDLVGVRMEIIIFLEKGKYNPSLKLAHAIGRLFDLRIEDVFIFEDQEEITNKD